MNQKGEIFLQESRSKMELESIRQYLNEKYKDSRPTETDLWCSPGQLCIVKYNTVRHPLYYYLRVNLIGLLLIDIQMIQIGTVESSSTSTGRK